MAYQKKNVETAQTETVTEKKEKKKFIPTEKIPCISITAGELFHQDDKSSTL